MDDRQKNMILIIGGVVVAGTVVAGVLLHLRKKKQEDLHASGGSPDAEVSYSSTWPIRLGSGTHNEGEKMIVRNVQKWLNLMGVDVEIDGEYGPKTEAAVKQVLGKTTITQDDYNLMLEKITGVKFT